MANDNNTNVYIDIVSGIADNGEFEHKNYNVVNRDNNIIDSHPIPPKFNYVGINANTIFTSNNTTFNGSEIWTGYGQDPRLLKANTINIAGKITNVYDNSGTINLEISEFEIVKGDITVQRVINGKLSKTSWNMTQVADNKYTLDLATVNPISLGAVEKEGMQFVVRYGVTIEDKNILNNKDICETYNGDIVETYDSAYINKLSFNNVTDRIYILTRFYNYIFIKSNNDEIQEDVLILPQYIDLSEPKIKLKDTPVRATYNYWCFTDVCNTTISENYDYLRVNFGGFASFDFYNEIGGTEKGDVGYLNYLKLDDKYMNTKEGTKFLLEFTYRLPVATKGGFYMKVVMSNNNFQTNYIFQNNDNKDWQTIKVPYTLKNVNENNKFAVYIRGVCNKGNGTDLNNMVLDIQDIHLIEVQ